MSRAAFGLAAAALLLAACGQDVPEARQDAVLPPEVADVVAVAPAPTNYTCAGGQPLQVTYPDPDTALINYAGRTFTLRRVADPYGLRYVGEGREWSGGTLRETQADSTLAGPLIAECSTVGGVETQP